MDDFITGYKNGQAASTDQCAQFQNNFLRNQNYAISGDAWALNGVNEIFSGYSGVAPASYDKESYMRYNRAATDNVYKNFDSNILDKDKPYVVNMYYATSPQQANALKYGHVNSKGTHTGILTYENGKWWVTHNIHGTVHREPFVNLQNSKGSYGVTAIFEPREAGLITSIQNALGSAMNKVGNAIEGAAATARTSARKFKQKVKRKIG